MHHFQYLAFLNVCSLAFPQALQEDILVKYDHYYSLKILLCKGLICFKIYFICLFIFICEQ